MLTQELADQYTNATLFGVAPLKYSLVDAFNYGNVAVAVIAIAMILIMTASQFYTQLQIMSKNQ
ncbi:membrane protein insertase YidC, partial [Schumannella luteola]